MKAVNLPFSIVCIVKVSVTISLFLLWLVFRFFFYVLGIFFPRISPPLKKKKKVIAMWAYMNFFIWKSIGLNTSIIWDGDIFLKGRKTFLFFMKSMEDCFTTPVGVKFHLLLIILFLREKKIEISWDCSAQYTSTATGFMFDHGIFPSHRLIHMGETGAFWQAKYFKNQKCLQKLVFLFIIIIIIISLRYSIPCNSTKGGIVSQSLTSNL